MTRPCRVLDRAKMSPDDIAYLVFLFVSIPLGFLIGRTPRGTQKHQLNVTLGLASALIICREDALHAIFSAVVTYCIIKWTPIAYVHQVNLLYHFLHLLSSRSVPLVMLHSGTGNALLLITTLRLVSLGFYCRGDTSRSGVEEKDRKTPPMLSHFAYTFCVPALMTGPFFSYQTYAAASDDVKTQPFDDKFPNGPQPTMPVNVPESYRLKEAGTKFGLFVVAGAAFMITQHFFPTQWIIDDEFDKIGVGFWYRINFIYWSIMSCRCRFFTAWLLAESAVVAAGLGGGHPRAVYNVEVLGIFNNTVGGTINHWNASVHYFLSTYIYRQMDVKHKARNRMITMVTSAYWHGVRIGYYLCFINGIFLVEAENRLHKTKFCVAIVNWVYSQGKPIQWIFYVITWYLANMCVNYSMVPFYTLGWYNCVLIWKSLGFFGTALPILFILVAPSIPRVKTERKESEQKKVK